MHRVFDESLRIGMLWSSVLITNTEYKSPQKLGFWFSIGVAMSGDKGEACLMPAIIFGR
jgi:hypothetical protein